MHQQLYPFKFEPILKNKIWGGSKLKNLFGKKSASSNLGESWELSGQPTDASIVTNGFLAGNNLNELIEVYMDELLGHEVYSAFGNNFPLLFKFIDANQDLSIQVHPNDELAAKRHGGFGKTEMWYVVDAHKQAELIIGFKNDCTKEAYVQAIADGTVEALLQRIPVSKGDVFFIPAGLIHAIGKGVVVAEIQQNSDLTYRLYDYKRVDDTGQERELHTELAVDAIHFNASPNPKTNYKTKLNDIAKLIKCSYFTTNLLEFDSVSIRNYGQIDSFVVYMCIEGNFVIKTNDTKLIVYKGDTVLVPACINEVELIPEHECRLLEVYV